MQYPVEVPGVSVSNFLRTAQDRDRRRGPEAAHLGQGGQGRDGRPARWTRRSPSATSTRASPAARRSATRSCRWSCSSPKIADPRRDRLRPRRRRAAVVSEGVNRVRESGGDVGVLLITHYTRILRYIKPDFVHVFVDGRIVEEGGPELADELEAEGYDRFAGRGRRPERAPSVTDLVPHATAATFPATSWPHPRRLPDPGAHRARRKAAGLPRLRRDLAASRVQVLDAEQDFYERHNSAVHRGAHQLAEEATDVYESAAGRTSPASSARAADEMVFTKNATEAINLVAYAFANAAAAGGRRLRRAAVRARPRRRDRRHRDGAPREPRAVAGAVPAHRRHAALVPRHRRRPARPVDLDQLITERTKVVAFTHESNVLGTVNPVATLVERGARGSAR